MSGAEAEPVADLAPMQVVGDRVQADPQPEGVSLHIGQRQWTDWQEVRVTRGIERLPSDFDLTVTESGKPSAGLDISPGAPCTINIAGDLVLTGYVDRYSPSFTATTHRVSFRGRSKCADLVDSAVIYQDANGNDLGTQISGVSALDLATRLAAPHGIRVTAPDGPGPVIPQHNAELTETGYEIIERVARFSKLLVYDDPDGNLVLAQAGTRRHASGFQEGVNVEAAQVSYSWDMRFTQYDVLLFAENLLGDVTDAAGGDSSFNLRARFEDSASASRRADGEPRKRRRVIVVESGMGGEQLAKDRAQWERARRYGRSQYVTLTTDTWRDKAGQLWEPNQLVPLDLPTLKVAAVDWLLVEVTYRRGDDGTHADLVLMPPEAVMPQPIILQPFDAQVAAALAAADTVAGGAAAP